MSELKLNSFSSTSPLFQSLVTFELSTYIRSSKTYYQFEEKKEKCETQESYKSFIKKHGSFHNDERILFVKYCTHN